MECRRLAYSLLGKFEEAIADYDAALKIRPDFPLALNNRAWAYYKLGRPSDGIADVERALSLSPGSPYALDTRAHIHQAQGRSESGIPRLRSRHAHGRGAHRQNVPVRFALAGALFRGARRRLLIEPR
ncbi:MAG: tetratricopeptide repeat protein [Hyphomicrobium sp.]